jgi:hypothetical protein
MILEHLDPRVPRHRRQQRPLRFPPRHVLRMHDPSLRVPPFPPQIQLPTLTRPGQRPVRKPHPDLNQFRNPCRPLLHHHPHRGLPTQSRPRLERVLHVQLEGILLGHHRRNASLGIVRVRFGALLLRGDRHPPMCRRLQRETQSCNPTPQHQEIEPFHNYSRLLSINRVFPTHTANAI